MDWWTFIAQVFNFLILVVLLRIFLYKPVLRAMDQRRDKIASHFEAAEQKEKEAEEKSAALDGEKRKFDGERGSLLKAAKEEAGKQREELTEKARREVAELAGRWRKDLEREKSSFLEDMQRRAGDQVCAVARKVLADLADAELERRMAGVLIQRLVDLSDEDRGEFTQALAELGGDLVVATAWELPKEDQDRLTKAVHEQIAKDVEVAFETAPELACGIELRGAGREISWTIASYVEGIRDSLAEAVDEKVGLEAARAEAEAAEAAAAEEKKSEPGPQAGEKPEAGRARGGKGSR